MKYILSLFFLTYIFWINSQTNKFVITIYFENNSSNLSSDSKKSLQNFVTSVNLSETKIDKLIAYCDTVGSVQFNQRLAEKRMNSVLGFISNFSISISEKIISGENYPAGSLTTSNLKEWRKVEIHYSVKTKKTNILQTGLSENSFETLNLDSLAQKDSKPIVLDIQFFPGVAVLFNNSVNEIDRLYDFLIENENLNISIRGHVCCNDDLPLSSARAETVFILLAEKGISKERMQFKGYSNTIPAVSPEITDIDRQKNRRVDVIFSVSK